MSDPREIARAIDRLIQARIKENDQERNQADDPGCRHILQAEREVQYALDELAGVLSH